MSSLELSMVSNKKNLTFNDKKSRPRCLSRSSIELLKISDGNIHSIYLSGPSVYANMIVNSPERKTFKDYEPITFDFEKTLDGSVDDQYTLLMNCWIDRFPFFRFANGFIHNCVHDIFHGRFKKWS